VNLSTSPEASEIQESFWLCDFFSKPALDEMINVSTCSIVAGTKYDHLVHTCPLSLYMFDRGCKCFLYALTHSLHMVFQIRLVRWLWYNDCILPGKGSADALSCRLRCSCSWCHCIHTWWEQSAYIS